MACVSLRAVFTETLVFPKQFPLQTQPPDPTLRKACLSFPVPAFNCESCKHPIASSKPSPMTPEAGVARAPSQPCAGEAPVLQGQKSRFVPWPLKRLCYARSPHLATDFSHCWGIGWEDGIDPNKTLAYFILIPRARATQKEHSVDPRFPGGGDR